MGAFAAPAIGAGIGILGDALGGNDPSTTQLDPTNPRIAPLQGDIAGFLQGIFSGNQNPFQGMTSPLQMRATDAISGFLSANPEQQTFDLLSGGLGDLAATGGGIAEGLGEAALPVFQRQLAQSLGGLNSAAPGRFSTAFANQGIDLASRAAQDFALLQANARQQEVQNRLGASGLLGTLAGSAGNGAFNRALGAGQLGLGQTQAAINPLLQLFMGGMNFAAPQGLDTVVGESPMSSALGGAAVGISLQDLLGRGGG